MVLWRSCPCREKCGASEKGQKVLQRHVWQEFLDVVQAIRKTDLGKALYSMRKETIERVFADAKEKHAMRYTHHRGLARVTRWVKLKFAAMNLKKLAIWSWKTPSPFAVFSFMPELPFCPAIWQGFFDKLKREAPMQGASRWHLGCI